MPFGLSWGEVTIMLATLVAGLAFFAAFIGGIVWTVLRLDRRAQNRAAGRHEGPS